MSRLGINDTPIIEEPKKTSVISRWIIGSILILILMSFLIIGSGSAIAAVYLAVPTTTTSSTTTTSTSTSTTTSTTTTLPTTSTTTSTSTTTTSTTSTTTTLCGGYYEPICGGGDKACEKEYVENSQGICIPYDCAPTVQSGNDGCGAQNLNLPDNWCQPGVSNPFRTRALL